jgi:hypothetical protein
MFMRRLANSLIFYCLCLVYSNTYGITASQVLVIYNSQQPDSQAVHDYYTVQRPGVLSFDLNDASIAPGTINYTEFASKIRTPIRNHLAANSLESAIHVLVLTKGLPHRIQSLNAANPDIGDSTIMETGGIGGFVMAAAPAIVRFVGGQASDALDATRSMYSITVGEHPHFQIPILEFRGSPVGIDVTRVVRTDTLPAVNTGIAGKVAGIGQVGAGLVTPPMQVFADAVRALAELAEPA